MDTRLATPRFLALAATVIAWASAFPAIRVGLSGLSVAGLSFLRLAVASAALAVAAPLLRVRRPARRDLPLIALCGVSGMSAYQLLLNWGEVHVPAGPASLLVACAPVFSVLLAAAFLGERLSGQVVLGSIIALAGAAVIAVAGGSARFSASALAVLAAAAVQGIYHAASKPLLKRHTSLEVACYAMWAGTAFIVPLAPAGLRGLGHAPAAALGSAVYLGLLPSALGFVAWGYAVARLPLATAAGALYLVPPVALLVAFAWLGEAPSLIALAGGVTSIGGVILINRDRRPGNGETRPAPAAGRPEAGAVGRRPAGHGARE